MAGAEGSLAVRLVGGLPRRPVASGSSANRQLLAAAGQCRRAHAGVRPAVAAALVDATSGLRAVDLGHTGIGLGASATAPAHSTAGLLELLLPASLPACLQPRLLACLPASPAARLPSHGPALDGAHSTPQSGTRTADEEAEVLIAMLEAMGNKMFRTKVLPADDVTYAEEANVFLKREEANLPLLVAARLKSAVHILLFNVNGIKAARKWVLQESTRCAIMYLLSLSFIVPDDKEHYYIGESKRSGCTHEQLCQARWPEHYYGLACGEHCNGKLQDAYGSASHPYLARTRAHPVIAAALSRGPGSRRYGMEVCASPGAPVRSLAPAPAFGERYPTARAGKAIPSQVATRSRRTGATR